MEFTKKGKSQKAWNSQKRKIKKAWNSQKKGKSQKARKSQKCFNFAFLVILKFSWQLRKGEINYHLIVLMTHLSAFNLFDYALSKQLLILHFCQFLSFV